MSNGEKISLYQLPVTKLGFSPTISKVLVDNHIYTYSDLVSCPVEILASLPHMTIAKINKILQYIKKTSEHWSFDYSDKDKFADIDIVDNLKDLIFRYVHKNSYRGVTFEEIARQYKSELELCVFSKNELQDYLNSEDFEYDYVSNSYSIARPSIVMQIQSLDRPDKKAQFLCLASGKTFLEVAEQFNISRQAVQDTFSRFCHRIKDTVREDRYQYRFTKYNFNSKKFQKVFNCDDIVFKYLNYVYPKGKLPVSEILNDERLTVDMRKRILHKDLGDIGETRQQKCWNKILENSGKLRLIVSQYMEQNCPQKSISITRLKEACAKEYSWINDLPKHNFETIVFRYDFLMHCGQNKVRMFDKTAKDLAMLVHGIDFKSFNNCVISADILYNKYSNLMKRYDIKSGNELFHILKYLEKSLPDYVVCKKMPNLEIGTIDKKRQVKQIYEKSSTKTLSEVAKLFEKNYGIPTSTFKANWRPYFNAVKQ